MSHIATKLASRSVKIAEYDQYFTLISEMASGRFSFFRLAREAMRGHRGWVPTWRDAAPKATYDIIIIGGGGHGLATAYYLAKEHGLNNVAVLERAWIGGGNTGRNTTIIRSNYLYPESSSLYDHALDLWENLSEELNYNLMFSSRGVLMLAHNDHDKHILQRHVFANQCNGVDNEWLSLDEIRHYCPPLDTSDSPRYPIIGGALQHRGGVARHDAVAWGYARAASELGVDVVQNCEVTGFTFKNDGAVSGVTTSRGNISAGRIGVVVAGATSTILTMAGIKAPLESFTLQALVSEPLKPVLPCVVMSNAVHGYLSQSDKGEIVIGAGTDQYASYRQSGPLSSIVSAVEVVCELAPRFRRLRMLRSWAGTVDVTADRSPIIGVTPVEGLYVNCGWGTGGFKATPGSGHVFAATLANEKPHPLNAPFAFDRFSTGRLINEAAAAAVAH